MPRRAIVAVAAASAVFSAPLAALAVAPQWSPTGLSTVAGLAPLHVRGAADIGTDTSRLIHVDVALRPRHQRAVDALIASGKTLSAAAYDARFAPTSAAAATVATWAASRGLSAKAAPGRTFVDVSGSAARVGAAFSTTLHTFRLSDGMRFRSNVTTARLPRAVASVTSAVVGLSDLGRLQLPNQNRGAHPAASISIGGSYGPQNFWSLYDAPAGITGAGQSLAIITAFDVAQAQADLPRFEAHFGLPHVPFSVVQVGPKGTPDAVASQEWDLDSQYATGFAPGASQLIAYMGTSLLNTDILATISRWVTDDATRQGSFSGGECESLAAENGFTAALNPVLQRAAAQGQSLFVASGDAGSQCPYPIGLNGVPIGIPGVEFPAASPYAIGVGGTTIYATAPTKEIAWYAGGGGIGLDKAPVWQQTVGGTFVNAGGRRGVPDVALDADPESGYICVFNGAVTPGVGGTSASAPSWQGIWARAESAHGGAVGFAGPVLYRIAANSFRDVKAGTNGLYAAAPGYDYTTGRGTPDITRIVSRA